MRPKYLPFLLAATSAIAAAQTAPLAEFEVASVKLSTGADTGYSINNTAGGVFTTKNVTLRALIAFAYDIRDFQLSGGPKWMETEHYDIVARPAKDAPEGETSAARNQLTHERVQALLASRFQLVAHTETREMPVYALVVAKSGLRIQPADDPSPYHGNISNRNGSMNLTKITMKGFSERALAAKLGSLVLDHTGLTGEYTFQLNFADDSPPKPGTESADRLESKDPAGPSLASALEEQIGLKLERQKAPVNIVVVDRVEHASAN